jgi:epoxyqueuosine reductase
VSQAVLASQEVARPEDPRAQALHDDAEARGFLVAWAPAELPAAARERYDNWIAARRHALMGKLARAVEVRFDAAQRHGWVRSAFVLAAPHAFPDPGAPAGGVRIGRVGRIFWVREQDYIERLVQPHVTELKRVCHELGGRCRDWIDQGPLPLRSHAANAGFGWVGRNAMLLRPRLGSYFTLAALLTSFDAAPARPARERCGSCELCVQRCPTGALLGDGTLDANRCTSYWTTQHPGLIPAERWEGIGDWVFGCDICQEVCPWNTKAEAFWGGYEPEQELAHPDLRGFFSASGQPFAPTYLRSAFERAGRGRMARNAIIVLANSGDRVYLPAVRLGAQDIDPLVRGTAAVGLVRLGDRLAASRLLGDPEESVRTQAEAALGGQPT